MFATPYEKLIGACLKKVIVLLTIECLQAVVEDDCGGADVHADVLVASKAVRAERARSMIEYFRNETVR